MHRRIHDSNFYNMDCISGARKHVPDESVDLIITDPPYGIAGDELDTHYNRKESFVVDGYVEIPGEEYGDFSLRWIKEAERILRPGGQIYLVSGYTNLHHVLTALRETDLYEVNHIIWKYNFGVYTRKKYVSSHYHILYWARPGSGRVFNLDCRYGPQERDADGRSLNYRDREDVWIINREYKPGRAKNKNELPEKLLTKMIQYSSNEGDLVCDLFMGGFSTARVAIGLGRRFVGFEIAEPIFDHGVKSLAEVRSGGLLDSLHRPETQTPENQGQRWTEEEINLLLRRYGSLRQKGLLKKEAVAELGREFGRGRFSIERIIRENWTG
jgi:site-specific DNA-methyltransferase (adenine-specific)